MQVIMHTTDLNCINSFEFDKELHECEALFCHTILDSLFSQFTFQYS